jgi:flagellar biosynthesis/type III secretory pathway ATPase
VQVFRRFLESAAEHGARMSAMDSATRNAADSSTASPEHEQVRQAGITASGSHLARRRWNDPKGPMEKPSMRKGKVVRIIGPVIDAEFPEDQLPAILNAVQIQGKSGPDAPDIDITAEVAQHLGENRVRCVAMEPTEGMVRGMDAIDTGGPISVPVGRETLGRIMNVVGKPVMP